MNRGGKESAGAPSRLRALGRRIRRLVPLAAWLGAIAAILWLLPQGIVRSPITGVVAADQYSIVAPAEGRLLTVAVELHQRVEAGRVVARLCDDEVRLQLERARLELEQLRADLAREQAAIQHEEQMAESKLKLDSSIELRRRTSELESARLDELQTQAELEETRIRQQGLHVETTRLSSLERQGITSDSDLIRISTERDALAKRIAELQTVMVERRGRVAAARQRLESFTAASAELLPRDAVLDPLRWRVKAQEVELERIALAATQLDLVAPASGTVERLLVRTGQWVRAGEILVTLVDADARRILAYVPEAMRDRIDVAAPVTLVRNRRPGESRQAMVQSVSQAAVLVPERLWRDPRVQEWGFEVVLAAAGDEAPGESVSVLLAR